jgi:hypothetical protein
VDNLTGRVAAFGPFFECGVHAAGTSPAPPWRGMDELLADPLSHVMLIRARLAAASGREPGAVEVRVAASVAHLGLVARLVAPALGAAMLSAELRQAEPRDVWWQPEKGGAFPLSLPGPCAVVSLLEGPVQQLSEAFGPLRVSPRILKGNVASAVNGAVLAIGRSGPEACYRRACELAASLYALPVLRGAATFDPFRRRSCCLLYRAAPGALCADCILRSS